MLGIFVQFTPFLNQRDYSLGVFNHYRNVSTQWPGTLPGASSSRSLRLTSPTDNAHLNVNASQTNVPDTDWWLDQWLTWFVLMAYGDLQSERRVSTYISRLRTNYSCSSIVWTTISNHLSTVLARWRVYRHRAPFLWYESTTTSAIGILLSSTYRSTR